MTHLLPQVLAADTNGAAGSPVDQIVIATVGATMLTLFLLWIGLGHRSGKVKALGRAADFTERRAGLPGWAALPTLVASLALLTAVFGMYWDIALHMDVGRDPGPLANPAHYFILAGLFGIFSAGYIAMMLPAAGPKPGPTFVSFSPTWHAPLGGVLLTACGAFALIGFPLDDLWHRIFGQDVTLWGPTHLMLIGGASMTLIGIAVLVVEGLRFNESADGELEAVQWLIKLRGIALSGGLLLGLSTFQAEFDFGLPQFNFVFQPILLMIAAAAGLVSVRLWGGRGSALGAVAFFIAVRGILSILVGPVFGETTPTFPPYLVEAILVELIALRIATTSPVKFGLACGVAIGTLGLAAEWGWSHLVSRLPMPDTLIATGAPLGLLCAIAGALVGAWVGTRLQTTPAPPNRALRASALAGALTIAAVIGVSLPKPIVVGQAATVTVRDVPITEATVGAGGRAVQADIVLDPPTAADSAQWFTVTGWQGDGLFVDRLEKLGPGHYRTTRPIPVHGSWKTMIRLAKGRSLAVVPIRLPADTAIPAPEVTAAGTFTRPFRPDHEVLQREQKPANDVLTLIAYFTIGAIAVLLLAILAWGLHRLGTPPTGSRRPRRRRGLNPEGVAA